MCQKGEGSLLVGVLCCEVNMGFEGIKVGEKLLGVFCLVDNKGVILVPKPDHGGLGDVLRALASKSSMNRMATKGIMGELIAALCTFS